MDDMRGGIDGEYEDADYYESIKLRGAAGVFFVCRKTRRILLAHRSDAVEMPRHWGGFGGAIDENEGPEDCVRREIGEEAGYHGSYRLHPVFLFTSPTFRYQNFVAFVDEEFRPALNWENTDAQWFSLEGLPNPLHPGMKLCLADEATQRVIREELSLNEDIAPDLIQNSSNLDPAMMTFAEYRRVVNPKGKGHDSSAYDTSLESLNQFFKIENYPRVLRVFRVNGLSFTLCVQQEHQWGNTFAIVNDENQCVGSLQDEWGCTLIMVAREYRGFGLGQMLAKLALQVTPDRPTGGETPQGYHTLQKAHRELVVDALRDGRYRALVKAGKMTKERAMEIINSARAVPKGNVQTKNLNHSDPRDLLLYGSDTTFVLYNQRMKDIADEDDYWIEKMVKGMIHFNFYTAADEREYAIIYRFGGDTQPIRSFLLRCAAHVCGKEGVTLMVDEEDLADVDARYLGQSHVNNVTGLSRAEVFVTGQDLDPASLIEQEEAFRASFDKHNEFYYRMVELADAKFRPSSLDESTAVGRHYAANPPEEELGREDIRGTKPHYDGTSNWERTQQERLAARARTAARDFDKLYPDWEARHAAKGSDADLKRQSLKNVADQYPSKLIAKRAARVGLNPKDFEVVHAALTRYTQKSYQKIDPRVLKLARKMTVDPASLPQYVYRGLYIDGAKVKDREAFAAKWAVGSHPKAKPGKVTSWTAAQGVAIDFMQAQDNVKDRKTGFHVLLRYDLSADNSAVVADLRNLPGNRFWNQQEILMGLDAVNYEVAEIFGSSEEFEEWSRNHPLHMHAASGDEFNETMMSIIFKNAPHVPVMARAQWCAENLHKTVGQLQDDLGARLANPDSEWTKVSLPLYWFANRMLVYVKLVEVVSANEIKFHLDPENDRSRFSKQPSISSSGTMRLVQSSVRKHVIEVSFDEGQDPQVIATATRYLEDFVPSNAVRLKLVFV